MSRQKQQFLPVGERTAIYRRGSTWYVNYQSRGRQIRRSLKTRNKKEAMLRAQRIETEANHDPTTAPITEASVEEVIQAFLAAAEAEGRARKTLVKYRFVTQQIHRLAEDRRLEFIQQLTPQFADAYRARLAKSGKAQKTIYNALVILRSLTLFAHRRRMTPSDPLLGYKLRKPKPTPQPCWTPSEADEIVNASPANYQPYFWFLRETGCRAGEGQFLTWGDVDFNHRKIHIRPKENWKPKTGDQRTVPMTGRLFEMLRKLPKKARWVFTAPSTPQHPQSDRQISTRRALQALKRVLAKLKRPGHLHTFRHTFISQALLAKIPEPVVRSWVGHVDPQIIRHYTHVTDDHSRNFMQQMTSHSSPVNDGGSTPPSDDRFNQVGSCLKKRV